MFVTWRANCALYFIYMYASFFIPIFKISPVYFSPSGRIQVLKTIIVRVRHKETDQLVRFSNLAFLFSY